MNSEMTMRDLTAAMKEISPVMAAAKEEQKNDALLKAAALLKEHAEEIFAQNRQDLAKAREDGLPETIRGRLLFDEKKLADVTEGITQLVHLPDPSGRVLLTRRLDEGLVLRQVTCPIGVIGVIFESRPDALVQISSLCIKSGNCAVLKGGRESANTNRILFSLMRRAAEEAGLPKLCLGQAETHSEIDELLSCDESVDLLIPRGSNRFVRYIMDHTRIPVMGHADGVCHIYVDKAADPALALRVIRDAKTQYPVACNAVETVLVCRDAAQTFLPALAAMAEEAGISLFADAEAAGVLHCPVIEGDAFRTEYGALKLSVAVVPDVRAAAAHINRYGSHHTDCIITEDDAAAEVFRSLVDSAGVYRNCSTRFADGFRYGLGAEVGISTGKIHARGPVGLEGLVTYRYELDGHGHIVGDYASGKRAFHFMDLKE